jgi:hypothetical protein
MNAREKELVEQFLQDVAENPDLLEILIKRIQEL